MPFTRRAQNVLRGLVQRYGPETAKRRLWNEEYATGRWDNLDDTGDENAHLLVEKYANKGSILDLGCGPGTTSIELNPAAYSFYTGLDISDVAIQKARRRAQESGHAGRNEYCQSDILTYEPVRQYNVILYGDSIYYIPPRQIVPMLYRYSTFLTQNGVIIARLFDVTGKRHDIVDNIQDHFDVVECHSHEQTLACLIVFRPRGTS